VAAARSRLATRCCCGGLKALIKTAISLASCANRTIGVQKRLACVVPSSLIYPSCTCTDHQPLHSATTPCANTILSAARSSDDQQLLPVSTVARPACANNILQCTCKTSHVRQLHEGWVMNRALPTKQHFTLMQPAKQPCTLPAKQHCTLLQPDPWRHKAGTPRQYEAKVELANDAQRMEVCLVKGPLQLPGSRLLCLRPLGLQRQGGLQYWCARACVRARQGKGASRRQHRD